MNTTEYTDYADYKYFYKGDDEILSYFSNNPVSNWSFELFFESINKNKRRSTKSSTLLKSYLNRLSMIKQDPEMPQEVKNILNNLTQKVLYTKTKKKPHTELNDQFFFIVKRPKKKAKKLQSL